MEVEPSTRPGGIFGVIQLIMLIDGVVGYPSATFNLMTGATVVLMASVVWFAYRWPKAAGRGSSQTAQDGAQREVASVTHGGMNDLKA